MASTRGELLAETTQGVDVRTFEWDAAGRLVEATVFTLTTYFTYTGDGARVAVGVAGVGVTVYIPDRGGRILVERTATTTTRYLYGRDCLGEVRDGTQLYYLADGPGYVRLATDEDGAVVDAWLFTPDGGVMAGPQGPVSHLVCGGVYDWSTGLLYQGGRYFDPTLGIWLALGPLAVIQGWRERKKRKGRRGMQWYVLVALLVVGVGVGGVLVGCGSDFKIRPPSIDPEWMKEYCVETEPMNSVVGDRIIFYGPPKGWPEYATWDSWSKNVVENRMMEGSLKQHYGGRCGFNYGGDVIQTLDTLGITKENPLYLLRDVSSMSGTGWAGPADAPHFIGLFPRWFSREPWRQASTLSHELAHRWDFGKGMGLTSAMKGWVDREEGVPRGGPEDYEDFAYTVSYYFDYWSDLDDCARSGGETCLVWCDDKGMGYELYREGEPPFGGRPDFAWHRDRFDFLGAGLREAGTPGFNVEACSCKRDPSMCPEWRPEERARDHPIP